MIKRIKVRVPTKIYSRFVQQTLFDMGVPWGDGSFEIKECTGFLFVDEIAGIRSGTAEQFLESDKYGYIEVSDGCVVLFDASPFKNHVTSEFAKYRDSKPSDYVCPFGGVK